MKQQVKELNTEIVKRVHLDYLFYLPEGYDTSGDKKWPLIVFLHGAGERGSDLLLVKKHGIARVVEERDQFPFIAVSPQCASHSWWVGESESVMALLDEIVNTYSVDKDRIYLTGLSMGGFGTWHLASEYPGRFAAIAPICGGGTPEKAANLVGTPIWAFHGAKDSVVDLAQTERMVEAVRAAGGDVAYTVYPEADHDSWTETYNHPALYDWFLSHKLSH